MIRLSFGGGYVGFFDEIDGRLEIVTKIDEFPFNVLPCVFLLFKYEHVMIEELL
jgi:hypothetical protein